jgi:hypothetical protein
MVSSAIKEFVDGILPPHGFSIGDRVQHTSGRTVEVVDGQYWGKHGISNFWSWREVLSDGTLGEQESGYGDALTPLDGDSQ